MCLWTVHVLRACVSASEKFEYIVQGDIIIYYRKKLVGGKQSFGLVELGFFFLANEVKPTPTLFVDDDSETASFDFK